MPPSLHQSSMYVHEISYWSVLRKLVQRCVYWSTQDSSDVCIWTPASACIPLFRVRAFASLSCEHAHLQWLLIVALLLRCWDNTNCAKHQIYRGTVRLSSYALCTFLASHPREVLPVTNVRVSATWLVPSVGIHSRTFHQLLLLLLLLLLLHAQYRDFCFRHVRTNVTKWKCRWSLFIVWQASIQFRVCYVAVTWIKMKETSILSLILYGCTSFSAPSKEHTFCAWGEYLDIMGSNKRLKQNWHGTQNRGAAIHKLWLF